MAGELRTVTGLKYLLMVRMKIPYIYKLISFLLHISGAEGKEQKRLKWERLRHTHKWWKGEGVWDPKDSVRPGWKQDTWYMGSWYPAFRQGSSAKAGGQAGWYRTEKGPDSRLPTCTTQNGRWREALGVLNKKVTQSRLCFRNAAQQQNLT